MNTKADSKVVSMPSGIVRGEIVHFNWKPDKMFGFIKLDQYPEMDVFFHILRNKMFVSDGSDNPYWVDVPERNGLPRSGDRVVCKLEKVDRGYRARVWDSEENWDKVMKEIEERALFRFVKREGREKMSKLYAQPKYFILWQGKDMSECRKAVWQSLSGGPYDFHALFVQKKVDDKWELCEDPR